MHRVCLLIIMVAVFTVNASASITLEFIGGSAPVTARGGGNLIDIMGAAAAMSEELFPEANVKLKYGWKPMADGANHTLLTQGGDPNRETRGSILFNSNFTLSLFMDPTPYLFEEYEKYFENKQDLGGGEMVVGRGYTGAKGDAFGAVNLTMFALHEIGHALGLSKANHSFQDLVRDSKLVIASVLPLELTLTPRLWLTVR
jgi:hypothetical protein